jgi:hypothetical protein
MNTTTTDKDAFGVLAHATELMPRMIPAKLPRNPTPADRAAAERTLDQQYKSCESAMITYLRTKTTSAASVADLAQLLTDALHAFAGLGARLDLLKFRTIGCERESNPKAVFASAIKNCTMTPGEVFDALPCYTPYTPTHSVDDIAQCAYYDGIPSTSLLSLLPVIKHLGGVGRRTGVGSCFPLYDPVCAASKVTGHDWRGRSLIGWFDKSGTDNAFGFDDFSLNPTVGGYHADINRAFVLVFTGRLDDLLAASKPADSDFFEVRQLRQEMYTHLATVTLGIYLDIDSIMSDIDRTLRKFEGQDSIPVEDLDDYSAWIETPLMPRKTGICGTSLSLNKELLIDWLDAVADLGLEDIDEHSVIAERIRAACA